MFDFSHCYYRFPNDLRSSRLDVLYNDAIFDIIEQRIARARVPFVPLSEVAQFLTGSRNPQENPDAEFLYVDIGSIDTIRGIPSPEIMVGRQASSSRIRRIMRKGNVLVSTTRPTRRAICVVPDELDDQICSTGFAVLQCKSNVLSKFLFYALRSDLVTMQFERLCSGSGYPAINQETDLPQVLVPKPDLKVQQEIIEVIELIEAEARRLDKQAAQRQEAANQVLLSNLGIEMPPAAANYFFRTGTEKQTVWFTVFPGEVTDRLHYLFFHPRYQELEGLCKRFRTVQLATICRAPIVRGEQPEYDEFGNVTVLKTVDLKDGYIDYDNALKVSREFFDAHPNSHVHKGDILIASTGYVSMGKVDVYERDEPAMVDGHISIVRVNDGYHPYFIACFLRSHLGQLQFEKWFTGSSGQIELQPVDLGKFIVPANTPKGVPLGKQRCIASMITEQLNQAYELAQQAKAKWQEAKDTFAEMIMAMRIPKKTELNKQ